MNTRSSVVSRNARRFDVLRGKEERGQVGMSRRRVLIIEELLSSEALWSTSSASLRYEATAMLSAVAADMAVVPDVEVTVLLSPAVMQGAVGTSLRLAGVQMLSSVAGPQAWLQEPSVSPQLFTETLVIAPESAGLLVQRLQQMQSGLWRGVTNLNVPWSLAAVLGDKAATAVWLHGHGIRTPPAWVLSDEVACRLQALRVADTWDATAWCSGAVRALAGSQCGLYVLKPRDGCGCGDVQLLRLDDQQFRMVCAEGERVLDAVPGSDLCWLLQPLQAGLPCSAGFVGSGSQQFVQTPVGQQSVVCNSGRFGYEGGSVPAELTVQQRAWPLLHQLGMALGEFRGWVGVDFVCGEQVSVIEVNPRLCTSYLGYRQLLRGNLAALLLGVSRDGSSLWDGCRAVEWGQQVVVF